MRPEIRAHARLQYRDFAFRVEPSTVHDADAASLVIAALVDELSDACARVGRCHTVQILPVSGDILSALQFSDLAPVDARRGKVLGRTIHLLDRRRRRGEHMDCRRGALSPTRIRRKSDHVLHGASEHVRLRRIVASFLHSTIVAGDTVHRR